MHLNSLAMRNFKKYRRAEVTFEDGLTGIVGSNGVGKSSIVEAIAWALYGNKVLAIKRDLLKNASARESDIVEVRLNMSMGKNHLSIYRSMRGKSLMPDASLYLDDRIIASGSREVDQKLEEILKMGYQDFMKTYFARQKDLDNLLKETGTGKREYLLKLLGLEDIKERSLDQIKFDRGIIEGQRSKLEGALSEIGDVEERIDESLREISNAEAELSLSRQRMEELVRVADERKQELEIQADRKRERDLLAEKMKILELNASEKSGLIVVEKQRLGQIEGFQRLLADFEPRLERLTKVKARLEELEPKRTQYEVLYRRMTGAKASTEATGRLLREREDRLALLQKDRLIVEELAPKEKEYLEIESRLQSLEGLYKEFSRLQAILDGKKYILEDIEGSIARIKGSISDLTELKARSEEIEPLKMKHDKLQLEMMEASRLNELKKEQTALEGRRKALQERKEKTVRQAIELRHNIVLLGDLASQEIELREKDRELDLLITMLNNSLADLKSNLSVQESIRSEAHLNLSRIRSLGAEGLCPSCERPLGEQYDQLLRKYESVISKAEGQKSEIDLQIQSQQDKLDGVAKSRSSFRKAFDELNTRKSRKAELLASLRWLEDQIAEIENEIKGISSAIDSFGVISFDPQRFIDLQSDLEMLRTASEDYNVLAIRLLELPNKEEELKALREREENSARMIEELGEKIGSVGYVEQDYDLAKKRLSALKIVHDRFLSLSQKIQEIPLLENKILANKEELDKLLTSFNGLRRASETLGFSPSEYESLMKERQRFFKLEEEAQKIRVEIAAEPEILRKLQESTDGLARIELELDKIREQIKALGYSEERHVKARQALNDAEIFVEATRKETSDSEVKLRVKERELAKLKEEEKRKNKYEQDLSIVGLRSQVLDVTRSSIVKFMDQVLVRVKDAISQTAGEILEEISGKYSLLKFDEDFNILVEDGGDFYPITRYSGGEVDMIAISVRIAISDYLMRFGNQGQSYSFLILDEIFGSQD
ncbi:MAG: SMC family ATPase, partial [Methanotrichaceae archaeon]|nr:SMC family ATPase [Methanotrichaceae archaeon]